MNIRWTHIKHWRKYCYYVFLCFCSYYLYSGQVQNASYLLHPKIYTIDDGLITNAILAIHGDSRGYLWLGTDEGISVFDGFEFTNYQAGKDFPTCWVNCFVEEKNSSGTILVGTNNGLLRYSNGKFEKINIQGISFISSLTQDTLGNIWCVSGGGIYRLDGERAFHVSGTDKFDFIANVLWTKSNRLWFGGNTGLFFVSLEDGIIHKISSKARPGHPFRAINVAHNGDVWAGQDDGYIIRIRDTIIIEDKIVPAQESYFFLDDGVNTMYVGFRIGGVLQIHYTNNKIESIMRLDIKNGLQEDAIRSALIDKEGSLWFGSFSNGLAKINVRSYISFPAKIVNSWNSLIRNPYNHWWTHTQTSLGEYWIDANNLWQYSFHRINTENSKVRIRSIAIDHRGNVWTISSDNVIRKYQILSRNNQPSVLQLDQDLSAGFKLPNGDPLVFMIDYQDRIWCGIFPLGMFLIDPKKKEHPLIHHYTDSDGLPNHSIFAIYEDSKHNIWFGGGDGGIAVLAEKDIGTNAFRRYTSTQGLPDGRVRGFYEDKSGRMWIGTREGGIVLLENDRMKILTINDGLPSNGVTAIHEDSKGTLWVATHRGLAYLDNRESIFRFISCREFIGQWIWNIGKCENGLMWLIDARGLSIVDPSELDRRLLPPPVYIRSVEVNHNPISMISKLELMSNENHIHINYQGVNLAYGKDLQYQTLLQPTNKEWSHMSNNRSIVLGDLQSGDYTFLVKAIAVDGTESTQPASFSFSIAQSYWKTWWFYGLIIIIVIFITTFLNRLYTRRQLDMERLRTRIAGDLHDDIGSSLTRITMFSEVANLELNKVKTLDDSSLEHVKKLSSLLEDISQNSREIIEAMGDVVWSLDPRNDTLDNLTLRMKNYITRLLDAKDISHEISVPPELLELHLPIAFKRNIYLIFKEILNNILRHSQATKVSLLIKCNTNILSISITDNGRGFNPEQAFEGNGLRNIRQRAELLGGEIRINSKPISGTSIVLELKIP